MFCSCTHTAKKGHEYIVGYVTDVRITNNIFYVDIEEHDLIICEIIKQKHLTCQLRYIDEWNNYLELEWFDPNPLYNKFTLVKPTIL